MNSQPIVAFKFLAMGFLTLILTLAWQPLGHAAKVGEEELMAMGWHKGNPPNSSCNYMIVNHDNDGLLLYYGESNNCKTRTDQHNNTVNGVRQFINPYDNAVQNRASNQLNQIRSDFVIWAEGNPDLSGDNCLAAVSVDYGWSTYYYDLPSQKSATDVEDCVLFSGTKNITPKTKVTGFKGDCNKIGSATRNHTWLDVKNTLRACGASSR
jgi:hypothetical protein